jgi:PP-loop superfamily ATP-utilizing enzyme
VREIARRHGLSVADKPSMACLSSRIPTGLEVTDERLSRIEEAERLLRARGFSQFRVRDHDGLARIEVGADELEAALDLADTEAEIKARMYTGCRRLSPRPMMMNRRFFNAR